MRESPSPAARGRAGLARSGGRLADAAPAGPLIFAATLASLATLAGFASAARAAPGFSHATHIEAGARCTGCHRIDAAGDWLHRRRIDHSACDAAGCHLREYSDPRAYRGRMSAFCRTCHDDLARRTYTFPPWRGSAARVEPSRFALAAFDHGAHQRQGAQACAQCHVARPGPAAPGAAPEFAAVGHETCGQSICHGGRVEPAMARCVGCHVLGDTPRPPRATRRDDPYRVEFGFTHQAHAAAAGEVPCAACHVEVDPGAGVPVSLPPMSACAACHDGTRVFSTTGTACGRCHVREEAAGGR